MSGTRRSPRWLARQGRCLPPLPSARGNMYRFIASIFFVFGWFVLSFGTPAYFSALPLPWSVLNTAHAASEPGTARVRAVNEAVTALLRRNPEPGSAEERKLAAE